MKTAKGYYILGSGLETFIWYLNLMLLFVAELVVRNVLNVLHEAGFSDGHWFQLGQQLIETANLNAIEANCCEVSRCMIDTIAQWLRSDTEASWEKLAEAVSKVGEYGEATVKAVQQKGKPHF